jgi:hypothetical protein
LKLKIFPKLILLIVFFSIVQAKAFGQDQIEIFGPAFFYEGNRINEKKMGNIFSHVDDTLLTSYYSKAWKCRRNSQIFFLGGGAMVTAGIGCMVIAGLPTSYKYAGADKTRFGNGSFYQPGEVIFITGLIYGAAGIVTTMISRSLFKKSARRYNMVILTK